MASTSLAESFGPWRRSKTTPGSKKAKLFYNGKALNYVVFADTYRWQHVNFADIMANQGDKMTLEILEVYPGIKSPNAAVTEIILQGAH